MFRSSARLAALCASLLASVPLSAQSTNPFEAGVRFVNTTTQRRSEWGLATVPFPQGVFMPGDTFGVLGHDAELRPFGLRWSDGSIRFAQLSVRLNLAGGEERVVVVREGVAPYQGPFVPSAWVLSRLPGFSAHFEVERTDGSIATAPLGNFELTRATNSRIGVRAKGRIPATDFAYECWIEWFDQQDNARFELRVTHSRAGSPNWESAVQAIRFIPQNVSALVRGATRLNTTGGSGNSSGPNPITLVQNTSFADGQAQEWWGDLVFHDSSVSVSDEGLRVETFGAIAQEPLFGCALNWRESNAFGPFGFLAEAPPWMTDNGRQEAFNLRADFLSYYESPAEPWADRPKALLPYSAATGNQHDFGVGKFLDVFVSGYPMGIEEARFVGGEEAQRPVHHLEADGALVRHGNHPNWIARHGRTHWSNSVSPDRLGKPHPDYAPTSITHGWTGKDGEHWSSIALSSAYLLTASESLLRELDHEAELYQASHTLPSERPGFVTNNLKNGRSVGRTLLTMSWNYLLTGNEQLRNHMMSRISEVILPAHEGLQIGGVVKPLKLKGPDPRLIASGDSWSPWEESQAVLGLEAAHRLTGSVEARVAAFVVAKNLVDHGWRIDFDNTAIGFAVRFLPGGAPLPPSFLGSPEQVRWGGNGFKEWALPATRFARDYGLLYGDPELAVRAQQLLDHINGQRRPPRSSLGWDTFGDWDSAR
ncbi:MAG: hypothetical protein AAF196_03465 [Planctomycetota bacterium]